jgi:replication initiation protein RepC
MFQRHAQTFAAAPESPPAPIGARRLNLLMREAVARADSFEGLPIGTAKPLRFLAAFQEAEPYLGLPAHAFKLVSWLMKQTQPQDWEAGSRPIAWPSARRQAEFLNLSPARVKALNRALFEAGIFVLRDNEQGKRYGRRGPDGRIIEAYGFDLSPLALRHDEFIRVAAEAKVERDKMRRLRSRVTFARRSIRQAGEEIASLGLIIDGWAEMEAQTADLVTAARRAEHSDELVVIVQAIERRKTEVDKWLEDATKPVNPDPVGLENEPHNTDTNLKDNPYRDTVVARQEIVGAAGADHKPPSPAPAAPIEPGLTVKPAQLVELAPRLQRYVTGDRIGWSEIVTAAEWLAGELGVSVTLWRHACLIMGRERAAVALALVSAKDQGHFARSSGAYFAGMVKKHEAGGLNLAGSLWALREAKWGKLGKRLQ